LFNASELAKRLAGRFGGRLIYNQKIIDWEKTGWNRTEQQSGQYVRFSARYNLP
jgi:hypothetical protein